MEKLKKSDRDYIEEYVKNKIVEDGYKIETSIENLIDILLICYEGELYDYNKVCYAIEDKRTYPENLMINIEDLDIYVYEMGGLKEFDYYP